ncbi:MAG: DUF423 domain-containing protein [Capnocytophaga sp.]|nr:DUF423 domain-containing protein [Capnocytophaga sp.]
MHRKILITAALLGGLAVALGAWGAHGLKALVPPEAVISFDTGVRYQMYHSLFLLFLAILPQDFLTGKIRTTIYYLMVAGILCFSFSIYFLATNSLTSFFDFKKIALITPLGGLFFIAGWGVLFFSIVLKKK